METNNIQQQPEGQPVAAAPQAGQPTAEPQKAANLSQAVERAAESANQTPAKAPEGQSEDWEWDGNPNTLPPQFAKYGKGVQRYFTKRSMSEAELRKAGEEHSKFIQSDEWKQYQAYRQSLNNAIPVQPTPVNQPDQPLFSQEDYENALLDPSGKKFSELVAKVVAHNSRSTEEKINATAAQLQQAQNSAQWNAALTDFAELHPEAVEYHSMGLMAPVVREEMASGKHKSYESVLNAALERVNKSVETIRQQELNKAQGRITEKKAAVTNTGTVTGDFTALEVDKRDVLEKAFDYAAQGKKVKVRSKR